MPVHIFLDCGSSVSLVSPSFVHRIGAMSQIENSNAVLTSFSNNKISVLGAITLQLHIGSEINATHNFIVTDMLDVEFLLGLDFLEENKLTIDFGNSVLRTYGGQYCELYEKPRDTPHVKKIRCKETVTIPPRTVQFISGKIPRTQINHQGITEPYEKTMMATGILMTPSIVYSEKTWVPVRCINVSDEPMTVYKGSMLGFLRPATEDGGVQGVNVVEFEQKEEDAANIPAGIHTDTKENRWTKEELYKALKLDEIPVEMNQGEKRRLKDVLWRHRSCFAYDKDDFGCCNMFQAHIELKRDYVPSWTPERKVPYNLEHHMDDLLDNMLKTGVVEPLTTESSWNSPIFLVAKSRKPGEKESYRVVSDLRGINKECLVDKFDLPNINHVLDRIGGDCIFSKFDMAASFHQVPYDEQSKSVTAFTYKGRRYNFARMIMGHCSSSSIFTRMVSRLLEHAPSLEHLMYFLDDLLLGSRDVETHIDRLEMMLELLMKANLKLTPSKTELMRSEVRYVGITVGPDGIRINDDRKEAIQRLEPPKTVKETQKVLGFFGYNRKFVRRYSEISKPLYALLQKGKKFEWTRECQESFDNLKAAISSSETLCFPEVHDPHDSYEVTIDASKDGLAATLTQMINGQRRTVGFFSKAVPRHKREWGQTKLEFESLCASLKHWDVYLRGAKSIKVITDCKSLLYFDRIFKSNPTMIRRFEKLARYNIHLEHVEGKRNVSDFLSRYKMKPSLVETATQTDVVQDSYGAHPCSVNSITPHCVKAVTKSVGRIAAHSLPHREESEIQPNCSEVSEEIEISSPVCDDTTAVREAETLSDLQILFKAELDSSAEVKVVKVIEAEESECYCGIPDMPAKESKVKDIESDNIRVAAVMETPEVSPDRKKIREEQDEDQILKVVKEWVKSKEKPKIQSNRNPALLVSLWKQFNLLKIAEDGLLLKTWVSKKNPDQGRDLIVIPEKLIEPIMKLHHSDLRSCHPGVDLSVDLCRRKFYWPKMKEDFQEYIAACEKCSEIKQPRRYLRAPLKHMLFHNFNDCIVVDHIVPETEGRTPRGYRYILTITDAWSNYLVAIPVKTQTAKENIEHIVRRWVLIFGQPKEIIVDNHPGFTSEFFHAVWDYFDCKVTHGTSYSSKSTAKAERSNKRCNQALRAAIPPGKERCWDIYLGYCVLALNSLKNRHTGYSSNRLVFGRETNTPVTLLVDNDIKTEIPSKKSKGAYEMYKMMKRTMKKVRENADTDFMYSKMQHDRNLLGPYFKKGDLCYVLINCPEHKYSIRWRGPLLVKRVINDHLYVVQITANKDKVVNISKMKHFARNKHNISKYPHCATHTGTQTSSCQSDTHTGVETRSSAAHTGVQTSRSALKPSSVRISSKRGPNLASDKITFPPPQQDSDDSDSDEDEEFVTVYHPQKTQPQTTSAEAIPSDMSTPIRPPSAPVNSSGGETLARSSESVISTPIISVPQQERSTDRTADRSNSTEQFVSFDTSDEAPQLSVSPLQEVVDQTTTPPRRNLRNRNNLRRPDFYGTSDASPSIIRRIIDRLDGILK